MHRKLSIIIQISILLLLFSCNKKPEDSRPISIGFSQCIDHDIWRKSMDHSMEVEASLHPDVSLTISNANRQAKKQILDIEKFIDDKVDVIIVSPYESESIVPVIEKAYSKGIPVIVIDRKVNTSNFSAYLGADNVEVGRIAGKYIVSSSHGEANVVELKGGEMTSPAYERSLGFNQIAKEYPNVKVSSIYTDNYGRTKNDFINLLETNPNINYIFCFNDVVAYNAWKVIKSKGLEKKINIIGVDGLNGPNGGIQFVKDGILKGTVLYPTGGAESIRLALRILNKEIVSKNNKLNTTLIDSLNAEIMSNQFDKITIQQSDIEGQQNVIKKQEQKYYSQNNLLKLLFSLLMLTLCLAVHSVYSRITISRKNKELEITNKKIKSQRNEIKKHSEELKQSNESRLNFFMGLSHEFKTPLTLILSSVESLSSEFKNKGISVNKEISLMYNNSRRLLRLINQLLDYRKNEDKKFVLRATITNLLDFSKNIIADFEREAKKRNIDFTLITNNPELEIYLDRNLMDKVYFNLLSNAFKFTPEKGKISISIKENKSQKMVIIHFKDSGIGIPENELSEVFNPFYHGTNNFRNGSGIGLQLSKSFIELHKGHIEVNSKNGAEFIITLPVGKEHLEEKEIIKDAVSGYDYHSDYLDSEDIQNLELNNSEDKFSILYIEDNEELLNFISNKLSVEYSVYISNGTDAINRALELIPDVILCDLNLPDKNGFEICEILKKDLRTSHIPIIILTSSDDPDSYSKALESGADMFLSKPFNLKSLSQSIKGLLFNREKLRFYYSNNILNIVNKEEGGFGVSEQDFLRKLNKIIEKNIENSNYTVEEIAKDLCISRVQLYRKVKAIFGISVSEHIVNIRLEKSKELLKNNDQNISEIAYAVGFSSPSYYSTIFKSKYGITPTDYRINI